MPHRIRLELAGVDSFAGSSLCACCPLGPLGCCAAPPAFSWADLGRIVAHGGADWLLGEIAAGRLCSSSRGLSVLRRAPPGEEARRAERGEPTVPVGGVGGGAPDVEARRAERGEPTVLVGGVGGGAPDVEALRCAYHGPRGCTLSPERRSVTCNDYLCEDALVEGASVDAGAAREARSMHQRLAAMHARWDAAMGDHVRCRWPDGPPWDAGFLAELAREHARLVHASAAELEATVLSAPAREGRPSASMH